MKRKVCVLGAGIIGLTSALTIQENVPGVDVTIVADKFSPNTTSDGSGGFWQPHLLNKSEKIRKWGQRTLDKLLDLLKSPDAADVGIQLLSGYNFTMDEKTIKETEWKDQVFGFRKMTKDELYLYPNMGFKHGVFYTTVQVDIKQYLPWLMKKFRSQGGTMLRKKITSLEELAEDFDIVVNSTGIFASELIGDRSVQPIRGQVTRVSAPWIKHFYIAPDPSDKTNTIYVLPFVDNVTLGGTSQKGNWNTGIDQEDRDTILSGCIKLLPSLQKAKPITDWTGLRPSRSEVRLELEEYKSSSNKSMSVIHNYGHSGSGVTLCWGCADDVADLVKSALGKVPMNSKL